MGPHYVTLSQVVRVCRGMVGIVSENLSGVLQRMKGGISSDDQARLCSVRLDNMIREWSNDNLIGDCAQKASRHTSSRRYSDIDGTNLTRNIAHAVRRTPRYVVQLHDMHT